MRSKLFFQINKSNSMSLRISEAFEKKPKKVYIFSGTIKEGGLDILEEEFLNTDAKIYIVMGIDKKNTTKLMLDSLLKYTKDIYIYSNNNIVEFDSSICIFEYKDNAIMYNLSSNISESGLVSNNSLYLETEYDFLSAYDKKEYKDMLKSVISKVEAEENNFKKLSSSMVEKLQNDKEIFTTKQYVHNVMSISELLGKDQNTKSDKEENKTDVDDVYASNIDIPKIDISDEELEIDDIDFSQIEEEHNIKEGASNNIQITDDTSSEIDKTEEKEKIADKSNESTKSQQLVEDVYEENFEDLGNFDDLEGIDGIDEQEFDENDTLDIASMLFSKADLKLDVDNVNEENKQSDNLKEEAMKVKKLNLNNVSNYIYELPSKSKTSKSQNILKIPNYVARMIPNFLELSDNSKTEERKDGIYKIREISLEVIEVKSGNKYTDRNATLSFKVGQSFVSIISDIFEKIDYKENDIARIIKLDSKVYHIEIIDSTMQEYKLWDKLCTQEFKASKRKYGMM